MYKNKPTIDDPRRSYSARKANGQKFGRNFKNSVSSVLKLVFMYKPITQIEFYLYIWIEWTFSQISRPKRT